ncbi:unnamed protein product [Echinostoma caproni]|uniref:WW domain-containing protein n=1 Tax=Echinostoma caproni TaxID=27848 RepID=A0A183B283_9TREM|nr:unnamed protein product [Echinostoma caproni]
MQLLQCTSFHSAEDITLLLQVMVQECLTRYTRFELLKRLANTESNACLKLFRQYNGLDMLAAFMCDSDVTDWELKRQILICLHNIPVSEQKQVQTNSRLMEIVSQWSVDPHFCRPRGSAPGPSLNSDDKTAQNVTTPDLSPKISENSFSAQVSEEDNQADTASRPASLKNFTESAFTHSNTTSNQNLTRSASTSALISDAWFKQQSISSQLQSPQKLYDDNSVGPGSSSLTVDVETGELEPSISSTDHTEQEREVTEEERIQEIQHLSQTLFDRWSKLPRENYRIPRLERQETEKLLHVNNQMDSSLVSWGHFDDQENATSSWIQPNDRTSTAHVHWSKRTETVLPCSSRLSNPASSSLDNNKDRLSKLERRRLFEAQVNAAEAKKQETDVSRTPIDTGQTDEATRLRQVSRLCEEMTQQLEQNRTPLPPGWQSAVDPSGKTYYYNMETKVVQWEKPQTVENEKNTNCDKTPQSSVSWHICAPRTCRLNPVLPCMLFEDFLFSIFETLNRGN